MLLIFLFGVNAQLPDYHLQRINTANGVSLAGADEIIQDHQGFLWILSENKLQRYDGMDVRVFAPAPILKKIFCDADGTIWCVTQQSLYRYVNDHTGFKEVAVDSSVDYLLGIYQLPDKSLWCSHTMGLLKYDPAEDRFASYPLPFLYLASKKHTSKRGILKQVEQEGYQFCLLQQDTLFIYDVNTGKHARNTLHKLNFANFISPYRVLITSFDAKSYEWDLSPAALKAVNWKAVSGRTDSLVYANQVLHAANGSYYLRTNMGLLITTGQLTDARKLRLFLDGMPLRGDNNIRFMAAGRDGRIFLLHETGILFFDTRGHRLETISNLSSDLSKNLGNRLTECLIDDNDNLWVASFSGFTRWNLRNNQFRQYRPREGAGKPALEHPIVWHIASDGRKILLTPDQQGLLLFDPTTELYSRPVFSGDSAGKKTAAQINGSTIYFIRRLHNGNFIFANRHGVYLLQKDTYRVLPLDLPKDVIFYMAAVEMDNGIIWLGTMRGLIAVDSQFRVKKRIELPDGRQEAVIICRTGPDELLVGNQGLLRINNLMADTPAVQPCLDFFKDKSIHALYKDVLGHIWIGAADGIYRYHTISKKITRITDIHFARTQHVLAAFYEAKDGNVFFCSQNGINYFRPGKMMGREIPPEVFITNVTVNNDDSSYLLSASLPSSLPYDHNSLVFDFVSPAFGPSAMHYRYRLQGFDRAWIDAGVHNQVRYAALPPGRYRFEVEAGTDGINWYPAQQQVAFVILPPFWRTGWFLAVCVVLVTFLAYMFYRYRQNRRRDKEAQLLIDYFANSGYEHSTVDDILWDIARNCISRLNFEDCVIYLVDEDGGKLQQKAAYGPKSPKAFEILNPIEIPVGEGITGTVAKTGKPEIVKDTRLDHRYIIDDRRRLSEITVPIIHEGRVIGIIDSEHSQRNFFNEKHVQVLQTIAGLCSAKISRAMALQAIQKSKLQLMELNMKMAESKFLNLRLQMNPHFLFNSLSSIQHLVVSQQTSRAYRYLAVFSNLLRSLLQYAEANFISLDAELQMMRMYLDLETLRFDGSFRYTITVEESLEQEEILIPSLMVQPFAENAIWHGLLHKEGEKILSIQFNNHLDEYLTCIVDDNGIGREKAAAIRERNISSMVHESKGIGIIRERLMLLEQKTGKPATVEIVDKRDSNCRPAGTRVTITIPFYNKEEV